MNPYATSLLESAGSLLLITVAYVAWRCGTRSGAPQPLHPHQHLPSSPSRRPPAPASAQPAKRVRTPHARLEPAGHAHSWQMTGDQEFCTDSACGAVRVDGFTSYPEGGQPL